MSSTDSESSREPTPEFLDLDAEDDRRIQKLREKPKFPPQLTLPTRTTPTTRLPSPFGALGAMSPYSPLDSVNDIDRFYEAEGLGCIPLHQVEGDNFW